MKTKTISLLAALSLAGLLSPAHAASYTEAQFTRLENEVKVLKENSAPHSAAVGENVAAVTSVATGANSRAELRFPDKSLTRLGANSRFTIRGEERTLDLDKGVMMLQVPKQMGGAKVRTAAVTAAVTGTTVIFEYLPLPAGHIMPKPNGPDMPPPDGHSYIKLIVIEGTVDFYSNKHRSHFQTVHAGQMIIMDPHSTNIPPPVDVDLRRLLRTSRLLGRFENLPNTAYVNQAVKDQLAELKNGTLLETNLVIPGLGTFVAFSRNGVLGLNDGLIFPGLVPVKPTTGVPPPPPPNNGSTITTSAPRRVPPHLQGFLPLIAGTTVLNENSSITTDNPQVTAYNSGTNGLLTSSGAIYHGQAADGPLNLFAFGSTASPSRIFQTFLNDNSGTWSTFKFDSLLINGAPNLTTNQVNDLLLVANADITLSNDNTSFPSAGGGSECGNAVWVLPDGELAGAVSHEISTGESTALINDLVLYSHTGNINFSRFSLFGDFQNIALNAAGPKGNVNFNNNSVVKTGGNLLVTAGQDVNVQGSKLTASSVHVVANQNFNVSDKGAVTAKDGNLIIRALNGVQISDSSTLKQFADEGGNGVFRIQAKNGPIVVTRCSTLSGNMVSIQAAKGGGTALDGVAPGSILLAGKSVSSANGLGVRSLASGGTVTVAGDNLNAARGVRVYASGNGGTIIFTQNTTIDGNFLTLAGTTVEVASGVTVTVDNSHVRVYTDNALYNTTGYGTIQYGSTPVGQTSAFAKRPRFHGPPPIPGMGPGFPPPKPGVLGMPPPRPLHPLPPAPVVTPMAVTPPTTVTPAAAPTPPAPITPTSKGV